MPEMVQKILFVHFCNTKVNAEHGAFGELLFNFLPGKSCRVFRYLDCDDVSQRSVSGIGIFFACMADDLKLSMPGLA